MRATIVRLCHPLRDCAREVAALIRARTSYKVEPGKLAVVQHHSPYARRVVQGPCDISSMSSVERVIDTTPMTVYTIPCHAARHNSREVMLGLRVRAQVTDPEMMAGMGCPALIITRMANGFMNEYFSRDVHVAPSDIPKLALPSIARSTGPLGIRVDGVEIIGTDPSDAKRVLEDPGWCGSCQAMVSWENPGDTKRE